VRVDACISLPYQGTIPNRNGYPQNIDPARTSIEITTLRHRLYELLVGGSRAPSRMNQKKARNEYVEEFGAGEGNHPAPKIS
jgi:hypothetical protein